MSSQINKYSNWMHVNGSANGNGNGTAAGSPSPVIDNVFSTIESDPQQHIYMETANATYSNNHENQVSPNSGNETGSSSNPIYFPNNNEAGLEQDLAVYQNNQLLAHPHLHHHQLHENGHHLNDGDVPTSEFLPLCDLLFNIISLAAYFCDVVFDSVTIYTLYLQPDRVWFLSSLFFVLSSAIISQILSLRWYYKRTPRNEKRVDWTQCGNIAILATHGLQCGILWRYFKLFIPVDLTTVKHEVRDLCMLRMVHAFCEAAPMLIIQVYLMWLKPHPNDITDLNVISTFLSLFSLCWALASFNKNARRQNIHKLVLTWLGVIFQFFWRLGTVSSRVVALTVYATVYHQWVLAVILMHWFSMLLWLMSPKNLFHGEKMSFLKRLFYSLLVGWVYIFCYINLHEANARHKMVAFYATMFLENTMLLSVCLGLQGTGIWFQEIAVLIVWGGFAMGLMFMALYYKFFHIRHLKHSLLASNYEDYSVHHCPEHGSRALNGVLPSLNSRNDCGYVGGRKLPIGTLGASPNGMMSGIPGVFNCRLNPALKRKKKKPSTFIPPPPHHPPIAAQLSGASNTSPNSTGFSVLHKNRNLGKPLTLINHPPLGAPPPPPPPPVNCSKLNPVHKQMGTNYPLSVTLSASPQGRMNNPSSPLNLRMTPNQLNSRMTPNQLASRMTSNQLGSRMTPNQLNSRMTPNQLTARMTPNQLAARMTPNQLNARMTPNQMVSRMTPNQLTSRMTPNQLTSRMTPNQLTSRMTPTQLASRMTPTQLASRMTPTQLTSRMTPTPIGNNLSGNPANGRSCSRIASPSISEQNDNSIGSRVNIQQKLQEKKQQQLMQLREIEEEIKQGKLKPHPLDRIEPPPLLPRAYPPQAKKQPWLKEEARARPEPRPFPRLNNGMLPHYYYHPAFRRLKLRSQTPEILLSPHYLEKSRVYYDYPSCVLSPSVASRLPQVPTGEGTSDDDPDFSHYNQFNQMPVSMRDRQVKAKLRHREFKPVNGSHVALSDIDSQVSLPRSYTLPREFRYYRGHGNGWGNTTNGMCGKGRYRKPVRAEDFVSNNSSDGDVDSDLNNDQDDYDTRGVPQIVRGPAPFLSASPLKHRGGHLNHLRHKRNETPL